MEAPIKSLTIINAEAKQTLVNTINQLLQETRIPFFMLETIMKEIYEEVRISTEKEYNQSVEQYNAQMVEYNKSLEATAEIPQTIEDEAIIEESEN